MKEGLRIPAGEGSRNFFAGGRRTLLAVWLVLLIAGFVAADRWRVVSRSLEKSQQFSRDGGYVLVASSDGERIGSDACMQLGSVPGVIGVAAVAEGPRLTIIGKGYAPEVRTLAIFGDVAVLAPAARGGLAEVIATADLADEVGPLDNTKALTGDGSEVRIETATIVDTGARLRGFERRLLVRQFRDRVSQCWVETLPQSFVPVRNMLSDFLGADSKSPVAASALLRDADGADPGVEYLSSSGPWPLTLAGGAMLFVMWLTLDLLGGREQGLYRLSGASAVTTAAIVYVERILQASCALLLLGAVCWFAEVGFGAPSHGASLGILSAGVATATALACSYASCCIRLLVTRPLTQVREL